MSTQLTNMRHGVFIYLIFLHALLQRALTCDYVIIREHVEKQVKVHFRTLYPDIAHE